MHWVELKLPHRVCWSTSRYSSNRTLKSATATTRSNVRFCPNTPKIRYQVDKGNPLVWVENHNRPFSDIQFLKPSRRKWSETGNQNYLHNTEKFWIELEQADLDDIQMYYTPVKLNGHHGCTLIESETSIAPSCSSFIHLPIFLQVMILAHRCSLKSQRTQVCSISQYQQRECNNSSTCKSWDQSHLSLFLLQLHLLTNKVKTCQEWSLYWAAIALVWIGVDIQRQSWGRIALCSTPWVTNKSQKVILDRANAKLNKQEEVIYQICP